MFTPWSNCSKTYYTNDFSTINTTFLACEVLAGCGFVPSKFRLTCTAVGDLGARHIYETGSECAFWLRFQVDSDVLKERKDINWILCALSYNAEFATAMHIFLGVNPGRLLDAIAAKGPDFAQISILRNRYANFLIDSSGVMVVGKSGRNALIRTFSRKC